MEITKNAYAKINLVLDVLGKRKDGYHEIASVMQTVTLCDVVTIRKKARGIGVSWNLPEKPDNKNTAHRAAELMLGAYNVSGGVEIKIEKRIPVSAGLGGGSADAAAVIEGINELYSIGLSEDELIRAGKEIGADVPFCILKGAAFAGGIGERLTKISSSLACHAVIVKPSFNISTKDAYDRIDQLNSECLYAAGADYSNSVADALKTADIKTVGGSLYNVFERVSEPEFPIIKELKHKMLSCGAYGALMSGSGPSVYGLFENASQAGAARDSIDREYGLGAFCCGFYNRSQTEEI